MVDQSQGAAFRTEPILAAEFAFLFVGLPLLMALAVPADWLWPILFSVTGLSLVLLGRTPGFSWAELGRGWLRLDWRMIAAPASLTAAAAALLVWWLVPAQAFYLPRRATELWLMIMLLYPLLSALPQELIFRVLFFRRYGGLFPDRRVALLVNGLVFGLAHLMFWNWVAVAMTVAGGMLFGWAYQRRGFAMAVVLHALCGGIIFTSGLGTYYYHGAVPLR
jgi:membrane protease YdiL (CAAX protease family)